MSAGTGNRGSGRWALREELGTATLGRSRLTSERVLRRRDSGCAWRLVPRPGPVSPLERGHGLEPGLRQPLGDTAAGEWPFGRPLEHWGWSGLGWPC